VSTTLSFLIPPLGLEPHVSFQLCAVEGAAGLYRLTADDDPTLRLFLLDARLHLPDYSPQLSDIHRREIGIGRAETAAVLVVVNPGDGEPTVNLLAPVVANLRTGRCQQVILADQGWRLRTPLFATA
jgi:flagellar assembly factor FliW